MNYGCEWFPCILRTDLQSKHGVKVRNACLTACLTLDAGLEHAMRALEILSTQRKKGGGGLNHATHAPALEAYCRHQITPPGGKRHSEPSGQPNRAMQFGSGLPTLFGPIWPFRKFNMASHGQKTFKYGQFTASPYFTLIFTFYCIFIAKNFPKIQT